VHVLRRNRDFRLLYLAQVVSYLGDWFATVALIGLILDRTDSEVLAASVFVVQVLPGLLATPLAGPAADGSDRRKLVITMSSLQFLAASGFLLAGSFGVGFGLAAQSVIAFLAAFIAPAIGAAVPSLVDREDLPSATALNSSTWATMLAVGAGLGGVFTGVFGRTAAFAADGISFLVAAAIVAAIRRPMNLEGPARDASARPQPIAELREGIEHVRADRRLRTLILAKFGLGISTGVVGLLAVFAKDRFHTGDGGIGALLASRGLGGFIGPWCMGPVMRRGVRAILPVCGVACLLFAVAYSLVPTAGSLVVACAFVALAHFGAGCNWVGSTYGLQVTASNRYLGRVLALDFALVNLTFTVSFLLAGWLGGALGPATATRVFAVTAAAWGVGFLVWTRPMWTGSADGPLLGGPVDLARDVAPQGRSDA
jgi:predicted MFS family arabinose efflux permease